jgi:hypothetical protein
MSVKLNEDGSNQLFAQAKIVEVHQHKQKR